MLLLPVPFSPLISIHGLRAFLLFVLLVVFLLSLLFSPLISIHHSPRFPPLLVPLLNSPLPLLPPSKLATPPRRLSDQSSRLAPTPPSGRWEGGVGANLASHATVIGGGAGWPVSPAHQSV